MSFDSRYEPHAGEPGRERWLGYTADDRVYTLMLRRREPRPWLVCVHGAQMGRAALDLTLFRAWQLHEDLGLNVVLPVLPMHGPRARGLPKGAVFPGGNLLDDVTLRLRRCGTLGACCPGSGRRSLIRRSG